MSIAQREGGMKPRAVCVACSVYNVSQCMKYPIKAFRLTQEVIDVLSEEKNKTGLTWTEFFNELLKKWFNI